MVKKVRPLSRILGIKGTSPFHIHKKENTQILYIRGDFYNKKIALIMMLRPGHAVKSPRQRVLVVLIDLFRLCHINKFAQQLIQRVQLQAWKQRADRCYFVFHYFP